MKMQAPFIASNLALAQSKEKVIGWAITFWYNTQVRISIHWKKENGIIVKCLHRYITKFNHNALCLIDFNIIIYFILYPQIIAKSTIQPNHL